MELLQFAQEYCKERGIELLFLAHFGSKLYGTDTKDSDTDLKGIFLPNRKDLLLGNLPKFSAYSSGNNESKNSKNDIDLELYSIHKFLKMVQKGETGALDLLFAQSNSDAVIYINPVIQELLDNPMKLFNPLNAKAYTGYAIGQANKYCIKGSRLAVLKGVHDYVVGLDELQFYADSDTRLSEYIDEINEKFSDGEYCKIITSDGPNSSPVKTLQLLGKQHHESTLMIEFVSRVKNMYMKYGSRSKAAMEEGGIDWKALSHAVRCLYQMQELLLTQEIKFPLGRSSEILDIKLGNVAFEDVQEIIHSKLTEIESLIETYKSYGSKLGKYNSKFVENFILNLYGE